MAAEHLTEQEILDLVVAGRGMCPFTEDVNDASMCICGLPALGHDETVIRLAKQHEADFLATVERIVARHRAEVAEQIAQAIEHGRDLSHVGRQPFVAFDGSAGWLGDHIWAEAARIAREHKEGQ